MEYDTEMDYEEYGNFEAECQGCDIYTKVNDIGLCCECAGKLDRDMIRNRDWEYSVSAFGVPKDKREELRNLVVKKFGTKLELIAEEQPKRKLKRKKKKNKADNNRIQRNSNR